jgi:sugar O-acyltransferase (sialic acid O-acetyltransferase NeuD family)
MATEAAVAILGAGGHAIVVADTLLAASRKVVGFIAPELDKGTEVFAGLSVIGDENVLDTLSRSEVELANGVGSLPGQLRRRELFESLKAKGWTFTAAVHPAAYIAREVEIGEGAQIFAVAVVQPQARLGPNVIVNTGGRIDHHVLVGAHAHIAPGATVCGGVEIGESTHVGAGATIRQRLRVADRVTIGAGAVVCSDIAAGLTVVGCPARERT